MMIKSFFFSLGGASCTIACSAIFQILLCAVELMPAGQTALQPGCQKYNAPARQYRWELCMPMKTAVSRGNPAHCQPHARCCARQGFV
jgi:hypothetical protein